MASFIGDYSCKADSKCRIMVPVSFRKVMAEMQQETFVVRRNVFEDSLDMYPYKEWEALVESLRARLNLFDRRHAAFMRELYRGGAGGGDGCKWAHIASETDAGRGGD